MELIDAIKKRRSIRKWQDRLVDKKLILELIKAAKLAQSAKNRQPWYFGILTGTRKNKIADIMLDWCSKENIKNARDNLGYLCSVKYTANVIKNAPVIILVYKKTDEIWNDYDNLGIAVAIEHICLRATDLGLGSLWIGDTIFVKDEICEYTKQKHLDLVAAILIGYPTESPRMRPRKSMKEILLFMDDLNFGLGKTFNE